MSHFIENKATFSEINEDCVKVNFFSTESNCDWENLCLKINSTIKTLSHNYIWHRDELKVYLPINRKNCDDIPMHLTSTVSYGDNIEDEWFIVYLVMEISNIYEDLIIQIIDSDGDFLLIEAANYLPSWANPETTENRVYIFNNNFHIIPPKLADLKSDVKLNDAIRILTNYPELTKVSTDIQESIKSRIGKYPQKIKENFHRTIVKLPLDVAALLSIEPSLIAPIVTTYCSHDIIDAKSCRGLNLTDHDQITTEVTFTKCLYAMLMHSKVLNKKHYFSTNNNRKDVLGKKMTCGFQMIMNQAAKDVFCTKEYINFEKNLKDCGYFKDNVEGSLEYNHLLDKARQYFLNTECPMSSYLSKKITDLMNTDNFHSCREILKLNSNEKELVEDNDDWLTIHPNQLNDLLSSRYGNQVKFESADVSTAATITTKLSNFLKESSDFEGIDCSKTDSTEIKFDADEFVNCLEKMMNFLSSDVNEINLQHSDSECESDMSEDIDNSELDKELSGKLHSFEESRSNKESVVFNLTQGIKEEGLSGPSSNLLANVGVNKSDLLDSDDE